MFRMFALLIYFLVSVIVVIAQSLLVVLLHKKLFIFNNFARENQQFDGKCATK